MDGLPRPSRSVSACGIEIEAVTASKLSVKALQTLIVFSTEWKEQLRWDLLDVGVGWWSNALSDCLVVYVRVHEGQRHDNPAVTESRYEYYQHPCRMSFWREEGTLSWVNCILVGQRRMVCDFLMDSGLSGLVLLDAGDTLRCVRQCGWLFFSFLFFPFFFFKPIHPFSAKGHPKTQSF